MQEEVKEWMDFFTVFEKYSRDFLSEVFRVEHEE